MSDMSVLRLPVDHVASAAEREAVNEMCLGEIVQGSGYLVLGAIEALRYIARLEHCARPGVKMEQDIELQ